MEFSLGRVYETQAGGGRRDHTQGARRAAVPAHSTSPQPLLEAR